MLGSLLKGGALAWLRRRLGPPPPPIASYVEAIALQLAPHMIRVNAIHPTNVNTQLLHTDDIYRAFRSDLENPTREDAEAVFPLMQAMPILCGPALARPAWTRFSLAAQLLWPVRDDDHPLVTGG